MQRLWFKQWFRMSAAIVPALLGPLGSGLPARGQANEPVPLEVKVYPLAYLSAWNAEKQVAEVFMGTEPFGRVVTLSSDPRTNALICRAPAAYHDQIAELLQKIDVESAAGGKENHFAYHLKHREAGQVAGILQEVRSGGLRFAFDSEANVIILQGPDAEVLAARRLLDEMDLPTTTRGQGTRSLLVSVCFVRVRFGASAPCQLPEALAGVAGALDGQGVGDCRLVGQVMARVREGEKFTTQGLVGSVAAGAGPAQIEVSGRAELLDQDHANLLIDARLKIQVEVRDEAGHPVHEYNDFGIETTTPVPLGDHLVLGAIPSKIEDSDTVVLVIQIK